LEKHPSSDTRPPPADGRLTNLLLAALPESDYRNLLAHLHITSFEPKQTVQSAGEPLEYVYFPVGGVFSITTELPDGTMVEAATVGAEGMLGIEAFLGPDAIAPGRTLLQVPENGSETLAGRLRVETFRDVCAQRGALYDVMGRYAQSAIAQMMQSAACNALHPVHERCARWLLMTHDRMHLQDFHLSHEFLAVMLGVQRPTVSVVAGVLQAKGLISYSRGHVRVLDRKGLEDASCMCYAIIRRHFSALNVKPIV
jgi:CRP-like cAMP-binding protein